MSEPSWSVVPAELLRLMELFSLSFPQGPTAAAGAQLCLFVATPENSRQFGLWLQEVMEIRGASAAESAPDPPPPPRLLFPLSQEPNTGPGHRDRAGECQESSQHICSLLCTFSPLWGCKERRRFQGKSPRSESGRTRAAWLGGARRATGQESESSCMEALSPGQHNKDQIIYFCHSPCQMKSNPHPPPQFDQRF